MNSGSSIRTPRTRYVNFYSVPDTMKSTYPLQQMQNQARKNPDIELAYYFSLLRLERTHPKNKATAGFIVML